MTGPWWLSGQVFHLRVMSLPALTWTEVWPGVASCWVVSGAKRYRHTQDAYLVADDVAVAVGVRSNEAVVLVLRVPARGVGLVVDPVGGGAVNGLAVGGDALNVAVGRDGGNSSKSCEDGSSAGGIHLDRHGECGCLGKVG